MVKVLFKRVTALPPVVTTNTLYFVKAPTDTAVALFITGNTPIAYPVGASAPTPTPSPTLGTPSITSDGTPQVGETLTGIDGAVTNLGANTLTRRWLLGTTVLATTATYVPATTGVHRFENRIVAPNGAVLLTTNADVTVSAAAGPVISFANPSVTIAEGNSGTQAVTNTINVVRNSAAGDFVVNLAYSGTATAGSDYVASPTSVTIPSGGNSASFTTTINGDTSVEPDETIVITATLAAYSVSATKTITITNDDATSSPPVAQTAPSFTGTPQSGQSLTGVRGTYTNNPTGYTDQWQQSADGGSTWSNISGATSLNFTPSDAQVGKILRRAETASNASGSSTPNYSAASAVVAAAGSVMNVLGVIDMTPQADPTVYPPTPSYTFYAQEGGYKVGDTVRVLASPNFDRSSPTINDASYVLTGNLTNDTNGINAKIAGITSGTGYVFVRPERSSENKVGDWSTPIQYGTTAVPALTSSSAFTVRSATKLAALLTYAAPVRRLMIYGNDMGQVELASDNAGTAYTLRWLNDGTRNYAITSQQNTQVDFNQDHIYDLSIEVTGLNGKTRRDPVTVEVQDYDTTPDAFTFAPTTGANLNAVYVREMTAALSGMASDYDAPVSITGPFDSFRIYNGTSYGPALTSTSGVTMRVGYKIELTAHSSADYLTERDIAVTIGGTTGTWALTTKADPSAVSPTAQPFVSANPGSSNSSSAIPLTLKAGVNVVTVVGPCGTSASTTGPGTTTSTLLVNISGRFSMWEVVASADGNYAWTMTGDGNLAVYGTTTQATALANAQAGAINVVSLPYASYESPVSIGSGTTVAAGNLAIVGAFNYADSPPSLINATALASTSLGARATVGYMTASATPKYTNNYDNGDQFANGGGIVAVWRKM